jgi:hypothetical protein
MVVPPGLVRALCGDIRMTSLAVLKASESVMQRQDEQHRYYEPVRVFVGCVRATRGVFDQKVHATLDAICGETARLRELTLEADAAARKFADLAADLPSTDRPDDGSRVIYLLRTLSFALPLALFALVSIGPP